MRQNPASETPPFGSISLEFDALSDLVPKQLDRDVVDNGPVDIYARTEEFARLLGGVQQVLRVYLTALVYAREAVDDILQETNVVLWREFESFPAGGNFSAWACGVAYNQVRAWRKSQQRDRLRFTEEFLDAVAREFEGRTGEIDQRLDALADCLQRLPEHHRQLIQLRYCDQQTIDEISQRARRSVEAVYRMLSRIRGGLRDCVQRKMAAGTHHG